jgi:hypothetical protein
MGDRRGEAWLVRSLIDEIPQEAVWTFDASLLQDFQDLVAGQQAELAVLRVG